MENNFSKRFKQIIEKQKPCEIVYVLLQIKLALHQLGIFDENDVLPNLTDIINARKTDKFHSVMSKEKAASLKNRLKKVIHKDAKKDNLNTAFFDDLDSKTIQSLTILALNTANLALELRRFMDTNPRRTGVNFAPVAIRQLMQTLLINLDQKQHLETLYDPFARTGDILFSWPPLPFKNVILQTESTFEKEVSLLFWNVVIFCEHDSQSEEEFITQQNIRVVNHQPLMESDIPHGLKCDAVISAIALPNSANKSNIPNAKTSSTIHVEYTLQALNQKGIAVLLIEDGFFHRSTFDYKIREQLVDEDLVEMVISLPANLYLKNAHFNAGILVINKNKPAKTQSKIKLINLHALKEFELKEIKELGSLLCQTDTETSFQVTSDQEPNFDSIILSTNQIKQNNFSLRPLDYINTPVVPNSSNFEKETKKLVQILDEWKSLEQRFTNVLAGKGG